MASSKSRISDPGQSSSNFSHGSLTNQSGGDVSAIPIDGFLRTVAYIPIAAPEPPYLLPRRTAEEVWREIVAGEKTKVCKQEVPDEELITLEDFLAKAGASIEEEDIKVSPPSEQLSGVFSFEMEAMGIGGRKRVSEGMDRAAQQRQKRMIKNRESASRSRERKQAYQLELESLVAKLEEENKGLLKEKAWRTEKQLKQILEKVIPVVEKPKVVRTHRKVRSMEW